MTEKTPDDPILTKSKMYRKPLRGREDVVSSSSLSESDGPMTGADARMVRRAVREGWPVTQELRERIVAKIDEELESMSESCFNASTKLVVEMDRVNHARDAELDKRARLDTGSATENQRVTIIIEREPPRPDGPPSAEPTRLETAEPTRLETAEPTRLETLPTPHETAQPTRNDIEPGEINDDFLEDEDQDND